MKITKIAIPTGSIDCTSLKTMPRVIDSSREPYALIITGLTILSSLHLLNGYGRLVKQSNQSPLDEGGEYSAEGNITI